MKCKKYQIACLCGALLLSAAVLVACGEPYVQVPDESRWNTLGYGDDTTAQGTPGAATPEESRTAMVVPPDSGDAPTTASSPEITVVPDTSAPESEKGTTKPAVTTPPVVTTRPPVTASQVVTTRPTAEPKPSETPKPVITAEPQTEPPSAATTKPQTTSEPQTPQNPGGSLTVLELTATVSKGNKATVTIQGLPNTEYTIKVRYSSGYSSAAGLEPKTSDAGGVCSWTWKVGGSTKPGTYPITISDGTNTYTLSFTVQ